MLRRVEIASGPKSLIKSRAKSVLMSRNSFICTDHCARRLIILSLRERERENRGEGGREREEAPQNPEGPPPWLLFLTPTRLNRIIDGIKRRSV